LTYEYKHEFISELTLIPGQDKVLDLFQESCLQVYNALFNYCKDNKIRVDFTRSTIYAGWLTTYKRYHKELKKIPAVFLIYTCNSSYGRCKKAIERGDFDDLEPKTIDNYNVPLYMQGKFGKLTQFNNKTYFRCTALTKHGVDANLELTTNFTLPVIIKSYSLFKDSGKWKIRIIYVKPPKPRRRRVRGYNIS